MSEAYQEAASRVRAYVDHFGDILDIQFPAVPYPLDSHQGIGYLLMAASINQGTSAETVRDCMRALHDELGDELFNFDRLAPGRYTPILSRFGPGIWKIHAQIPRILGDVSRLIRAIEPHGGMVERGRRQVSVEDAVERLARAIHFMGRNPEGARKKAWMFMRWMVRPAPDVGVWGTHLSPADLRVPLDVNTGMAFLALQQTAIGEKMKAEGIRIALDDTGAVASTASNVEAVTTVARWLFPDDPARVDYAFFCFGRRFGRGEDTHRCWKIVGCDRCPIRSLINCKGVLA